MRHFLAWLALVALVAALLWWWWTPEDPSLQAPPANAATPATPPAAVTAETVPSAAAVPASAGANEAEAREAVQRARVEVEASKSQALADLREEVIGMTVQATEAILSETLDPSSQAQLVDRYIDQVGAARHQEYAAYFRNGGGRTDEVVDHLDFQLAELHEQHGLQREPHRFKIHFGMRAQQDPARPEGLDPLMAARRRQAYLRRDPLVG